MYCVWCIKYKFCKIKCILVLYTYIIYTLFFTEQLKYAFLPRKIIHFFSLITFYYFINRHRIILRFLLKQ
ncbi:hypothetical protein GLOIN_2v1700816 [Rhizophagus irregularis DAOM 181602=DAOM 197198]